MISQLKSKWKFIAILAIPYFAFLFVSTYPTEWSLNAPGGLSEVEGSYQLFDFETYETNGSFYSLYIIGLENPTLLQLILAHFNDAVTLRTPPVQHHGVTQRQFIERASIQRQNTDNIAVLMIYDTFGFDIDPMYEVRQVITLINRDFSEAETLNTRDRVLSIQTDDTQYGTNFAAVPCDTPFDVLVIRDGEEEPELLTGLVKLRNESGTCVNSIETTTFYHILEAEAIFGTGPTWIGGPSGALMQFLQMYDSLIEDDLIQGRKIAGTGTLSFRFENGNLISSVGTVGGIKQKVIAAGHAGVEIFFVPPGTNDSNYNEAVHTNETYGFAMEIVRVETWQEAVAYLLGEDVEDVFGND